MKTNERKSPEHGSTRRGFIKKTAAAAATVAAVNSFKTPVYGQSQAPSTGRVIGANDRINTAVIGVGGQGFNAHVRNLKAHGGDNNVEVLAVCDVSKTRVDMAKEHVGPNCKGFAEHERLLDEMKDVDAVWVATVDHWHAPIAIDAMNAGMHVYCEKPMTRYLGEAFDVSDVAQATGKLVQVGAQRTSAGQYHKAAEIARNGGIGPLVSMQGSYMRNNPKGEWNYGIQEWASKNDIDWARWLGPIHKKIDFSADHYFRWRKYYPYCVGVLGDLLPHRLHPLMLATGKPEFPTRVVSVGNSVIGTDKNTPDTPPRDVDENVQLIAEFPSGMNLFLMSSTVNEVGVPEIIRGQHATLYVGNQQLELRPERPWSDEIDPEDFNNLSPGEAVPEHHKNFFNAIRTNTQPSANIDLALKVQTVVSLAEMSDRLNVMCVFNEKTRKVTTGSREYEIDALTYGTLPLS